MCDPRLVALAAVFVAWWSVSACNQIHSGRWIWWLRRNVLFGLLPLWTFFAPNPTRADARLVWRAGNGEDWSSWQEVHFGFAPSRSRWLLNPSLILNKTIADLVDSVIRLRPERDDRRRLLGSGYMMLLALALNECNKTGCESVQFAIARTSRGHPARKVAIAFLSEVHDATPLEHV